MTRPVRSCEKEGTTFERDLRPEIFFSYRNYLTIFTKNNASHRKAQVLIVNRKLAAFLPQILGKKCNMRYKSLGLKHCMRCPPLREGGCVSAGRVTCTQPVITSQSPAAPAPLTLRPSFYKRKRRKNCWSC